MNVTFYEFDAIDYDEYFESEFLSFEDMDTTKVLIPSHKLCECALTEIEDGLTLLNYSGVIYLVTTSLKQILKILGSPIYYTPAKLASN